MAPAIGPGSAERSRTRTLAQPTRTTLCMPCRFGLLPHPRSEAVRPAYRPPPCDCECPLVSAACGTWVARPVGTMWLAPVGEGSPLAGRCGSPRVTTVSLVSCEAARQPVAGRDHGQSSHLLSCPRGAHATTTPGSDYRSAGETSRSSPRLSSAVQWALIGILALRTKTHQINTCNLPLYHCVHELSIR
jgi:hypothetical protein